jgi:hypothetical protein
MWAWTTKLVAEHASVLASGILDQHFADEVAGAAFPAVRLAALLRKAPSNWRR